MEELKIKDRKSEIYNFLYNVTKKYLPQIIDYDVEYSIKETGKGELSILTNVYPKQNNEKIYEIEEKKEKKISKRQRRKIAKQKIIDENKSVFIKK